MFNNNIEVTGFHNCNIYKEVSIYFWSKKVTEELLLLGPAKVESQGAISETKVSIQLRNRDEETREQTGHLLFGFNWKTQGVRKARVDIKEKVVEKCLHRSIKLKCNAHALFQARHELHRKVHLKEGRIHLKRKHLDRRIERNTYLLIAARAAIHNKMVMKNVDYPQMKSQKLRVKEHLREYLQAVDRDKEMRRVDKWKELSEHFRKSYFLGSCFYNLMGRLGPQVFLCMLKTLAF
ncbi:hypothetical protein KY284_033755 [Solanum tuberosum]|nr:hypothetical protein KY284_033755 [Solanum tuberosum]